MHAKYTIRRAESSRDSKRLHKLFADVFHPQQVGVLAETLFNHLPRMKKKYWFIAEDRKTKSIISAFALIPWVWEMEDIRLNVAEMGIVGTRKENRNQGLMRILNREFDATLKEEKFDLAVIQGIPGFYQKFGYYYAVPLENHINVLLHTVPDRSGKDAYSFRLARLDDIAFLLQQDEDYRRFFPLSAFRDAAIWKYLLTESLKTEYGSEYWIMQHRENGERFYVRIPQEGFGNGLIVSEISSCIHHDALTSLLGFCKRTAIERDKPYIRLNVHNESPAGAFAVSMGAEKGKPYAWQIKVPDRIHFLTKIAHILERRIADSSFEKFSGTIRLDFFTSRIDLQWSSGKLESVEPGGKEECSITFCINADLFPALCLGHRTWQELQYVRPDIFPALQYIRPNILPASDKSALLMDTLFPARRSWIHEQY